MVDITAGLTANRIADISYENIEKQVQAVQTFQTSRQTLQAKPVAITNTSQTFQTSGNTYRTESLDNVKLEGPTFLDNNLWFPRKAAVAICARRRTGKSTLCLYYCAQLSRKGYDVLIIQREDFLGIVKARLQAMHADLDHIRIFSKHRTIGGYDAEVEFGAQDLDGIIAMCEQMKPDLVYVDPLHALARGDMNKQTSVDFLPALLTMAQRINCCVLGVLHTGKNPTTVESAISGSEQWAAKLRSTIYMEPVPSAPDTAIAQQVDASYSDLVNREIKFSTVQIKDADGNPFNVRIVTDATPTQQTAQDMLDMRNGIQADRVDPDEKSDVAEWLHDTIVRLGNHAFAKDIQVRAKAKGWTANNLRSAYAEAGIQQTKQAKPHGRSVLYNTNQADYCTADRQKFHQGMTPENMAKQWSGPTPQQQEGTNEKANEEGHKAAA